MVTLEEAYAPILGRLRYRIRKGIGDRERQEAMVRRILEIIEREG